LGMHSRRFLCQASWLKGAQESPTANLVGALVVHLGRRGVDLDGRRPLLKAMPSGSLTHSARSANTFFVRVWLPFLLSVMSGIYIALVAYFLASRTSPQRGVVPRIRVAELYRLRPVEPFCAAVGSALLCARRYAGPGRAGFQPGTKQDRSAEYRPLQRAYLAPCSLFCRWLSCPRLFVSPCWNGQAMRAGPGWRQSSSSG